MEIKSVVAITPVWGEPLGMIQKFFNGIEEVRKILTEIGIGFRHYFLDDGAINLPDEFSILVRHQKNEGLTNTLRDGFKAVLQLRTRPDLIVRLDCQEHDPGLIPFIVDHFSHSSRVKALFLPVWYWVKGEDRPLMREIVSLINKFVSSLNPMDKDTILEVFNQKFPLGYQCFRTEALELLLPDIEKGIEITQKKFEKPIVWGLDLLTILLAANKIPNAMDFVFGGWSTPWQENRPQEKIEAQWKKAAIMVEIAAELGCK